MPKRGNRPSQQGKIMKVLFVDDEPDLLELGKIFLQKEKPRLEIDTAPSPIEGIEKLDQDEYDAIISDYDMPKMDGLEFYQNLQQNGHSELPFIVFTGSGKDDLEEKAQQIGVDEYMRKGGNPKSKFSKLAEKVSEKIEEGNGKNP